MYLIGIGSSSSCRRANRPGKGITAAKRFDITSLPAAHPGATPMKKKRPKPSKDRHKHKHKHTKPKKTEKDSSKQAPKIDLELKLNDEPKNTEPEQQQVVVGQPIHHRPWVPYMHRPLYPFHTHHHHPHYFPQYMPHTMRYAHPSYWRFQGYFPHFLRRKAPWYLNPSDMRNIHHYPEYQFGDVQFIQSNHPFSSRRPPFRDHYDLSSDVQLLDRPEELHQDITHSKNNIKNHKEYNKIHEQDRKMVDDSEDTKETLKSGAIKQTRADERIRGANHRIGEDQVLNFNPTEREDEETNYPEYKSEFNTDHFWSTVEKRQRNINNRLSSHEPEKDENAIFRDFTPEEQGFDLDDISSSTSKRKEKPNRIQKVRSGEGVIKIKSDSLGIANAISSFA